MTDTDTDTDFVLEGSDLPPVFVLVRVYPGDVLQKRSGVKDGVSWEREVQKIYCYFRGKERPPTLVDFDFRPDSEHPRNGYEPGYYLLVLPVFFGVEAKISPYPRFFVDSFQMNVSMIYVGKDEPVFSLTC